MSMKAYSWHDEEDNGVYIVYAANANKARLVVRALPECELDYIDIRVKREPWADKYAETCIPAKEWLEAGYGVYCEGCLRLAYKDEVHEINGYRVLCKDCAQAVRQGGTNE